MASDDEYELEKLRAEIQQEKQMKEMLEQSAAELRITVEELEKRYDSIDNEGNEWKTRFETQEEMNQQLERQIIMLQDKVEDAKRNLKDAKAFVDGRLSSYSPTTDRVSDTPKSKSTGITINISVSPQAGKTPRDMKTFDDLSDYLEGLKKELYGEAHPGMVKGMEREKNQLYNQLRDLEWRLDQESKAYHKANDERKQYVLEINTTKGNLDDVRNRQKVAVAVQQREVEGMSRTPRQMGPSEEELEKLREQELEREKEMEKERQLEKQHKLEKQREVELQLEREHARKLAADKIPSMYEAEDVPKFSVTYAMVNKHKQLLKSSGQSNIPEDQRIIDPRRGPIRRTAAVKILPSLETT